MQAVLQFLTMKMETKPSSETPVTIIQPKRRHIPEDLNLDKHIYEKLLKTVSSNKSVSSKIKASARSEVLRVALLKMQLFWDSNCVAW